MRHAVQIREEGEKKKRGKSRTKGENGRRSAETRGQQVHQTIAERENESTLKRKVKRGN